MPDQTSNRGRRPLPSTINPASYRCLPVFLPDDPEWIASFEGALEKLQRTSSWEFTSPADQRAVADVWQTVNLAIKDAVLAGSPCAEQPDEGTCTTLAAHHPAISYWPNNPVLQPNEAGPYSSHVWRVGNPVNPFEQTGDSYIDPLAFLGIPLSEVFSIGLPYWHIAFEGSGEVDLGMVQTLQGGAMWVFPDGNPLAGDLVSLQYLDIEELAGVEALLSLLEIIGQSDFQIVEAVHTVEFATSGEHSLTGWMIPTVEPAPPFLGIGGGLRSIQLCGDITVIEDTVIPYTLDAQPDGTIRLLADGIPVSTLDLKSLLDDDYVNTEGDTMTGQLVINNAQSLEAQYQGAWKTRLETGPNIASFTRPTGAVQQWNSASSAEPWFSMRSTNILIANESGLPFPTGSPFVLMVGNKDYSTLALLNAHETGPLLQGWDRLSTLRSSLEQSGLFKSLSLHGYDYSSTTWRKQFGLSGDWLTATDAIRQGIVKLHVSGFDGDYEVFTAEYGEDILDLPAIAFFGGTPHTRQPLAPTSPEGIAFALADQLNAYSLTDIDFTPPIPVTTALNVAEQCSAAYYFANSLAAFIEGVFTNLSEVTGAEVTSSLIDTYGIRADVARQVVIAVITSIADEAGILDDLTDPEVLAINLQSCDFDQACFFAWLDTYGGFATVTIALLKQILDLVWDSLIPLWLYLGALNPDPACELFVWPCQDFTLDFRYGIPAGVSVLQGTTPGGGAGLVVAPSGPNFGSWVNIYFDECQIDHVEVDVLVNYVPQWLRWAWYQGPIGSETEQGNSTSGNLSTGPQTITINLAASASDTTKLTIRFENEGTEDADNVIYQIRVYME